MPATRFDLRRVRAAVFLLVLIPIGGCAMIEGVGRDLTSVARWAQNQVDNGTDEGGETRTTPIRQ